MTTPQSLAGREINVDYKAILRWIARNRVAVLIGLGIFLRVAQYLANRSYWMDEASLSANIRSRTLPGLFGPLTNTQLAPPGFLAIEWLACQVLGDNPFSLRLLPLLAGIASLFLFRRLATQIARPGALTLAIALFAFSDDLIYFSSELKQYSTDLAIGLGCTLLGLSLAAGSWSWARVIGLAAAGAAAVWFSHSAAFVIAGVGTVLFLRELVAGRWKNACGLIPVGVLWAASVAELREVSHRQLDHRPDMWAFWNFAFPPWPPSSAGDALWPLRRFFYLLANPLDYHWPLRPGIMVVLPGLLLLVGFVSMIRRKPVAFALLALPLAFALLASYLRLFPFHGRLVLFLVPSLLILIAEGVAWVGEATGKRWVFATLAGALLLFPVLGDAYHVLVPRTREGLNRFGDRRPDLGSLQNPGFDPDRFPF